MIKLPYNLKWPHLFTCQYAGKIITNIITFIYLLWSSCSIESLVVPIQEGWPICWYKSTTVWGASISKTCSDIFIECFFALVSFGPFQALGLISFQLVTFLKDRLVSQARPFLFPWQRWLHVRYKYWKQSALRNRKSLAYETKPTVGKHKQKHSSNKHGLMVQWSSKIADMPIVWVEKIVGETKDFLHTD